MLPTQRRIQQLFQGKPELLQKPRIPIADRAERLLQQQTVSREQAEEKLRTGIFEFEIAGKHFKFCNGVKNIKEAALVASHVGSLFDHAYIDIFIRPRKEGESIAVNLQVASIPTKSRPDRYWPFVRESEHLVLCLSFEINKTDIFLGDIESMRKEGGGKAVAALYNVAKDLEIPKIWYSVMINNTAAMRFYYQVDFGRAKDRDLKSWEVVVASGNL